MNPLIVQYGVPAAGVVLAALIAAIFSHHTATKSNEANEASNKLAAKAAEKAATTAAHVAEAEMREAVANERDAAAREWAKITEGMQRWNESLQADIKENARRIDEAELRALADRERAERNERAYSKAIIYLRKILRWIDDTVPGENYPPIPPELKVDL